MEKREFKNTGFKPSLLGFGCMRFPTLPDGTINEVEAEKMLDTAIANGVTYIDTAYPYHNGESEPFVGRALKKYDRSSFYLATKLPIWELNAKEDVKRIFEDQLKRLNVDYVDFYLLHALDQEKWQKVLDFNIVEYCLDLKKEGKIRNLGFSFHDDYPVFETILNHHDWDFCQIQFNYVDTEIQAGIKGYELATSRGIPVVVMEPIKGGTLANLPSDIASIFKNHDVDKSLSSWALRWVASFSNVKVILSGMSTMIHVTDNLATFNDAKPMTQEEITLVEEVAKTMKARVKNGCTGCAYCMPCPYGVDIPRNFRIWNDYSVYQNKEATIRRYFKSMETSQRADQCQLCGACETMCPQQIQIRSDLKRVHDDLSGLQ